MANQKRKSRAEKAAMDEKKKRNKKNEKASTQKKGEKKSEPENKIPVRILVAALCLGLFVLFLIIFLRPNDGGLIVLLGNLIHGIFGRVGFLVSIPVLLYLFFIFAFSGNRPVQMRSICLGAFVLLCGCLSHMFTYHFGQASDLSILVELYQGGISGTTGGILCGGLAMILHMLCGEVFSCILLIIALLFTLLGGLQITIPSIIRAIQNRPRPDWEEEQEEKPEPAAILVNHIANKRIQHLNNKRIQAELDEEEVFPEPPKPAPEPKDRAHEIIRQIDNDVESPVTAAGIHFQQPEETPASRQMPELELEQAIPEPVEEKVTAKDARDSAAEVAVEIAKNEAIIQPVYQFPPIELLRLPFNSGGDGTMEMRENTRRLNETLASFKIEAHIINVTRGPSVTRYEVELEKGVKLNKITTAADDIALSLGASGVRIAAIPGKISVVGIEVPNRAVSTVSLREVVDSQEFTKAKSKSSFAVGKDIGGTCVVGNIAKLPHMLIAGTTGSGKSVCMNSLIISLLYKASPEDVKLIMVDPKMVELGIYNGIPHLLIPVVTDPKKAAGSLQWAVMEMMRRYKIMSDVGAKDLESYNTIVENAEDGTKKLPQVVVLIDELADLMLVAAKEVEESICRIAQMGRASGIHLVIATQRPSADVITGLMKANIPSRIAFAVSSAMESRIILDTMGAEKLVGRGDMLYAPIGCGKPRRVQGCFVSDAEVEAVIGHVKQNYNSNYDQQVMEEIEKKAAQTNNKTAAEPEPTTEEMSGDEMLPAAVDVILETGQASVSMLQRRLKLGYARAARIVDEMEERGIVGPFAGSKPRAILVTKEQWESMKSGQSSQMDFSDYEDEPSGLDDDLM